MYFQLQSFSRLMSSSFSVRSDRFMWLSPETDETHRHARSMPMRRVRRGVDRNGLGPRRPHYFSAASTLARPALAQTSSFSPPGAPETPTPPMVSLPALIG